MNEPEAHMDEAEEGHCEGCCGGPMSGAEIRAMELSAAMSDAVEWALSVYWPEPPDPNAEWADGFTGEVQWWGECDGGPSDGNMIDFHEVGANPLTHHGMPVWHLEPAAGERSQHFGESGTLGWYRPDGWKDEALRITRLRWVPGWEDGVG
jgi:hypothetical protein